MQLWFTEATESLQLHVTTEVETCQENPFNYLLEPWAIELAYDYPHSLKTLLDSYLRPNVHLDPTAFQLAQEIHYKTEGNTIAFLATLNQLIYENCQYIVRETGEPWFAGVTWNSKQGSCRDFVVLFMEVCRAIGLAARFVSGYQEGDREQEKRDLHAWVEVYLPGAGWRGYDPTLGLAVADRHIAVAASSIPNYTAPISGHVVPVQPTFATGREAISKMETHIFIDY
jgi:transglutaminase-like putative cysteine protease